MIMKYTVIVTERLERKVEVEANTPSEAKDLVKDMYYNEEIILNSEDKSEDAEFWVELV